MRKFLSEIIIVRWGHLRDYVENSKVLRVVHCEIFGFCFRPLSIIFTMTFELSGEQFRSMILYDWKSSLNYRESYARLIAAWRSKRLRIE